MLLTEIFGKFLSKHLVKVLACIGELLRSRHHKRVVGNVDNAFKVGHLRGIDDRCHHIAHKKQLGAAVVYDVVNLLGRELMQDWHSHGSIG